MSVVPSIIIGNSTLNITFCGDKVVGQIMACCHMAPSDRPNQCWLELFSMHPSAISQKMLKILLGQIVRLNQILKICMHLPGDNEVRRIEDELFILLRTPVCNFRIKTIFPCTGILIIQMRRSWDRLIPIFFLLVRYVYIEMPPWVCGVYWCIMTEAGICIVRPHSWSPSWCFDHLLIVSLVFTLFQPC